MEKELIQFKKLDTKMPFIEVSHNNIKINLLIDTGCTLSCIDKNILDLLVYESTDEYVTDTVSVSGIADEKSPIVKVPMKIGNCQCKVEFNAIDMRHACDQIKEMCGITVRGFLGSDFLYDNSLILDFDKHLIKYTDGNQTSIDFETSEPVETVDKT